MYPPLSFSPFFHPAERRACRQSIVLRRWPFTHAPLCLLPRAIRNIHQHRYIDIDFVPTDTLHSTLTHNVLPRAHNFERVALVVPQWEATPCIATTPSDLSDKAVAAKLPRDFDALRAMMGVGDIRPFLASLHDVHFTPDALVASGVPLQKSNQDNAVSATTVRCSRGNHRMARRRFPDGVQLNGYLPWLMMHTQVVE